MVIGAFANSSLLTTSYGFGKGSVVVLIHL